MKKAFTILILMFAAAVVSTGGCDRPKPAPPRPGVAEKTEWLPEEIARDPAGYLRWSDRQIEKQINQRETKLLAISDRRNQIEEKQQVLADNLRDVENVRNRLITAYQQSEDEDRWPVRMAGRVFERAKAQAILEQTRQYLDERQPLRQTYDQSLQKMDQVAGGLRADVQSLKRLREKLALDLEQVNLNQGLAEMDKWRKTESELASMGKMLSSMSDDPLNQTPPREPPGRVDIEAMLK